MMQIIIGKEGNQPFVINDECVSRRHAIFSYDESTNTMTLTDNNSVNGTYVRMGNQYQRISQCSVDPTTDVKLGPYFSFRIGQLFQQAASKPLKPSAPKEPERADITHLRRISEEYERTKIEIEQRQSNIGSLKSLTIVFSMVGGLISAALPMMGNSSSMKQFVWVGPCLAITLAVSVSVYCAKASKKVILKKNANEKNYKIMFSCPKCHLPFTGRLYENILAEGKCPKCKTEFYDTGS